MQDIRKSPEYQRWRREIKHRDENTCRICAVQRNLHVHHIKPSRTQANSLRYKNPTNHEPFQSKKVSARLKIP